MDELRRMLDQTITHDVFGPRALSEPAEVDVPEKYEVQACIGRGGFGAVYRPRDKLLDRSVALKILTNASPTDLERFRREARFAARLSDPAIVQIYEFGARDGQPYIAMQFIDGHNLSEAGLDRRGIVAALRGVAKALHHAHDEGIVHRDLKPANVLIDEKGRAFLTDFGIARDVCADRAATLSREGALIGTPALMSPEQARGDLQAVDARTDIYALGATLYTMVCGRYPFERRTLVDALHAVLHDDPPLPRSVEPSVPRALEAIILRCMQKQPAARYASMAEVIADLDAFLEGAPAADGSSEWFRMLVGAQPRRPVGEPESFETAVMEAMREIADWDANLYRVSRNISRYHPTLDALIDRLADVVRRNPAQAWARFQRGVALHRRGRLGEALDEMERSIDRLANEARAQFEMGRLYLALYLKEHRIARKHFSEVGSRAHLADWRGRLKQAEVCFQETRRLGGDLLGWQIEFAQAVSRLADEDYDGCIRACDAILTEDPDVEDVWKLRGDALRFSGGDPFDSYEEAIRVRRSFHEVHVSRAEAHFERGEIHAARACLASALEIYPEHVEARVLLARSHLLEARERDPASGAIAKLRRGLEEADAAVQLQADGYEPQVTRATLLIELGRAALDGEQFGEAIEVLERATKLDGCQNRVKYLAATALLERARLGAAADRDADLERVIALATEAQGYVESDPAWSSLLADAQRAKRGDGDGHGRARETPRPNDSHA